MTIMYSTGLVLSLCVTHEVWKNPINVTHTGLHMCKVIGYSGLSDSTCTDLGCVVA